MKKRLWAALTAIALCMSMAGCHVSTPASVGTIGEIEISAGIYLTSQFQAYQTVLGYANTAQSSMSVSDFLKETVYIAEDGTAAPEPAEGEEQTGEARSVSEFIESETMANLTYYAAVETLFDALGGELTAAEIATAESYASQLWEYYGDLYEANGIGESTLLEYQYVSLKNSALLDLLYGTEGTMAVSEQELIDYLNDEMIYGHYLSVPLYNTADYTFADDTQQTEIVTALTDAIAIYDTALAAEAEGTVGTTLFVETLTENVAVAYDVMGSSFDSSTVADSMVTDLYSVTSLAEYLDADGLAAVSALGFNEATAFKADYTSAMIFLRTDPLQEMGIDELRSSILSDRMGDTLVEYVEAQAAELEQSLDTSAMAKFSTSKIVSE